MGKSAAQLDREIAAASGPQVGDRYDVLGQRWQVISTKGKKVRVALEISAGPFKPKGEVVLVDERTVDPREFFRHARKL